MFHKEQISDAISRLLKLGLLGIDKEGRYFDVDENVNTASEIPNISIRKFHKQVISKALVALETQDLEQRDFSSNLFAIDLNDLDEMKKNIKCFRRNLTSKASKSEKKNALYALNIQFFRIDTKEGK